MGRVVHDRDTAIPACLHERSVVSGETEIAAESERRDSCELLLPEDGAHLLRIKIVESAGIPCFFIAVEDGFARICRKIRDRLFFCLRWPMHGQIGQNCV
jgi:hypothetical protein